MAERTWVHVPSRSAAEACPAAALDRPALALLHAELTPRLYLERLIEAGMFAPALAFLAHALPRREAVWWACQAVRAIQSADAPAAAVAALRAAERWVADPNEDHRKAALAAAEGDGFETAVGLAAAAAGWSGGNLAPPGLPAVAPDPRLTPRAVAGAVALAALELNPDEPPAAFRALADLGVQVAEGTNRWEAASQPAGNPRG